MTRVAQRLTAVALLCCALAASAAAIGPAVDERTLDGGATLLVSEQHGLPVVILVALLDAGSRRDPVDQHGLANLTADLLTEGTQSRSANEIANAIEFVGGSLSSGANVDYATISMRVLRRDLDLGLELFADVLLRPSFPAAELERTRDAVLASLKDDEDDPTTVAGKAFGRELYGPHPYGHPVEGDPASVSAISRDDLKRFYAEHYGPEGTVIAVVGDVEPNQIASRLGEVLAAWQPRPRPPLTRADAPPDSARRIEIDRPVSQASVVIGHRGVARTNPDYEALTVVNYVLGGGGFSSRMMDKIRSEAGLVYGVSSYFSGGQLRGSFRVVMQTKNESVPEAIALARAEIERMRADGITAAELEDAKRYLTGSFPLNLDSNNEIASYVASTWFLGLGADAADRYLRGIDAVSLDDAARVAAQYLHPDRLLEVIVADTAKLGAAAPASETPSP